MRFNWLSKDGGIIGGVGRSNTKCTIALFAVANEFTNTVERLPVAFCSANSQTAPFWSLYLQWRFEPMANCLTRLQ